MSNSQQSFAYRLKTARTKKKLSQDKLAELSGMTRSTLVKYELGNVTSLNPKFVEAIAKNVSCTFDFLMYGIVDAERMSIEAREIALKIDAAGSKRDKLIKIIDVLISEI